MSELHAVGVEISFEDSLNLQFIARRKYNRFDLFAPGETFQSRLPRWLLNFEQEDRQTAMNVVHSLTFLSNGELRALAVGAFNTVVEKVSFLENGSTSTDWNALIDGTQARLSRALSRTLFTGATDDVMFDFFRRNAQRSCNRLGRENFVEYYKLHALEQPSPGTHDYVVLLDQLSASGTSLLRREDDGWHGKLPTFQKLWEGHRETTVLYVPYLMTEISQARVVERLGRWCSETGHGAVHICPVMSLPVSPCIATPDGRAVDPTKPVARLCAKYHDRFHDDVHTMKGGATTHGFGQAGLTLVLATNVPNNSLPIIWHDFGGWIPLFPRVLHHREVA